MDIKQWENKNLSHFSYGILSNCEKEIVLIDPSRDPAPYLQYAKDNDAKIIAIMETHPHADFISSHKELHDITGAKIYTSKLVHAQYPHHSFDDGDAFEFGKIKLSAINTPGHSPDSISILMEHSGKQHAVFTGDTLFIGDCGRPDLREGAGNIKMNRKELAKHMYNSLRQKLAVLEDQVILYPAHGAGTLCGKSLSDAHSSTIGDEKQTNWSLQEMTEEEFINQLLADQPFIPAYFPFDVEVNRKGASGFVESTSQIKYAGEINVKENDFSSFDNIWIVDVRDQSAFKKDHLPHSINIMQDGKFETWLGSLIQPHEQFYLVGDNEKQLKEIVNRVAIIGYESQVVSSYALINGGESSSPINVSSFKENLGSYTIVDVRNAGEVEKDTIFNNSINIPLSEIRQRINEIPGNKPIVVHCAGGYRSAAASSIIEEAFRAKQRVFDLGDAIKQFSDKKEPVH